MNKLEQQQQQQHLTEKPLNLVGKISEPKRVPSTSARH